MIGRRRTDALSWAATDVACSYFGTDRRQIWERTTAWPKAEADSRLAAIYLMVVELGMRPCQVADILGRHHSTVAHALATVEERRDDADFDAAMTTMELQLRIMVPREDRAA